MTEQLSPITPTDKLLYQWCAHNDQHATIEEFWEHIATQAARWGADQELEACVKWIEDCGISSVFTYDEDAGNYIYHPSVSEDFRAARRPKPPSLKEQALKALTAIEGDFNTVGDRADTIRRALEALDD
jgi:hypothetical protein